MAKRTTMDVFEDIFGKDLADQVRSLMNRNRINSVGRQEQERAQRQPNRPPEESEHWLDKLDK